MYVIIVGCGYFGASLALKLADEGHDVVVIDKDKTSFSKLGMAFNGLTIIGVGIDEDILKKAGIEKSGAVIAATRDDNTNIMIAEIAKTIYKVPKVMARVYLQSKIGTYKDFNVDFVCPTTIGVEEMYNMLFSDGTKLRANIGDNLSVFEVVVRKDKNFKVEDVESKFDIRICAVKRGNFEIASEDLNLQKDDVVIILSDLERAKKVSKYFGDVE
ncbi:MAG: potassium transporter TrkA [Mesoaciditoga sp.]|uniref:potassium channel family protein n=1 Tax=Athalassotoga sp. TaxID=2022597 RepID=UPI000CBD59C6|nr:MAG: potassium transporter TrkA [Mesoaciditoga sp.]